MKIVIFLLVLGVVGSLFSGLYFVGVDRSAGHRAVTALTVRIVLSLGIFALLMASHYFGWLGPTGRL